MLAFLETLRDAKVAWVALIAAIISLAISPYIPPEAAVPLLVSTISAGVCGAAYLIVHSLAPLSLQGVHAGLRFAKRAKIRLGDIKSTPPRVEQKRLTPRDSTPFFANRFASAFPGLREVHWYYDYEAIRRLESLLRYPLVFVYPGGGSTPIWWWRGGNLGVSDFRVISKKSVVVERKELDIQRIAAVPYNEYYRSFVYIESRPMPPIGLYPCTSEDIQRKISTFGYASEEYGIYEGKHFLTREECDDNAAVIRGKPAELDGRLEMRERYLSHYNFLIAPHMSPINNADFDPLLRTILDGMLTGTHQIEDLADSVKRLPRADSELH